MAITQIWRRQKNASSEIRPRCLRDKRGESINLRVYVDVLKKAARSALPHAHKTEGIERRVIEELVEAGLLSDAKIDFGNGSSVFTGPLVLTPQGAFALIEWSEYLRKQTGRYKFFDILARLSWIVFGAVCAGSVGYFFTIFS